MKKKLNRIGMGMYRMSIRDKNHLSVLTHAVNEGVNLIDSAPNYSLGDSEKLVGSLWDSHKRKEVFLLTKVGYISGKDRDKYAHLISNGKAIKLSENSFYSLEKEFINEQIESSLKRMKIDYIDCLLIHNPEYYISKAGYTISEIHDKLRDICEELERIVSSKLIRSYGISSNIMPQWGIDLERIFRKKRMLFPNFKFVQFPYNLVENEASKKIDGYSLSLIEYCKKHGIKTIANRPLNTTYENKVLRLANYTNEFIDVDFKKEEILFHSFLKTIKQQLEKFGENGDLEDFAPLKFLINNRKKISNPEAVQRAVDVYLYPFIEKLQFTDSSIIKMIKELSDYWVLFSKKSITERALKLKTELIKKGVIDVKDNRKLSVIACESYLKDGIDHVLVGMRKKKYIDDFAEIINS